MSAFSMAPVHHSAVTGGGPWSADPYEGDYRPFHGYGGYSGYYGRCQPWRGTSNIPHHYKVESREDGIANGRIFYASNPDFVTPRQAAKLMAPRVFRMDARHAAVAQSAIRHAARQTAGVPA